MTQRSIDMQRRQVLVQTSPFLGQVVLDSGEVHVVDKLIGKFQLYNTDNTCLGIVKVTESKDLSNTKLIDIHDCNGEYCKIHRLTITEDKFTKGNLGCQVWLSSLAFILWCEKHHALTNLGHVLELGCGVGLCGIYLASSKKTRSFVSSVTLTDGFECLKDVVATNISQNDTHLDTQFKVLKWEEHTKESEIRFDTIIATDCIYTTNSQPLIDTIFKYVDDNGRVIIFNTAPDYRKGVQDFIDKVNGLPYKVSVDYFMLRYLDMYDAWFIAITIQK